MAEEEESSSYGAYYEHLDAAGELNPFTILGIAPVMGAYGGGYRHCVQLSTAARAEPREPFTTANKRAPSSHGQTGDGGAQTHLHTPPSALSPSKISAETMQGARKILANTSTRRCFLITPHQYPL